MESNDDHRKGKEKSAKAKLAELAIIALLIGRNGSMEG
jgi:hypothetical protein